MSAPTPERVRASERRRDRGIELGRKTKAELLALARLLRPGVYHVGGPETLNKRDLVSHILLCEDEDRGDHCSAPTCRNSWFTNCAGCDTKLCGLHDRTHECNPQSAGVAR